MPINLTRWFIFVDMTVKFLLGHRGATTRCCRCSQGCAPSWGHMKGSLPVIRHRWLNQRRVTPPDAAVWFWCAIGGVRHRLPGFGHTIIDCKSSRVTPTGWIDFRNLDLFLELKCVCQQTCAFMSAVLNKTKMREKWCRCISAAPVCKKKMCWIRRKQLRSCVFVLCFHEVGRGGWKNNVPTHSVFRSLCILYRPVEFSRRTLPSVSLCLWAGRGCGVGGFPLFWYRNHSTGIHSFKPSHVSRALPFGMITHTKKTKTEKRLCWILKRSLHTHCLENSRFSFILTPHPRPILPTTMKHPHKANMKRCDLHVPVVPEMCFEVVKKTKKQSCIKNEACFISYVWLLLLS